MRGYEPPALTLMPEHIPNWLEKSGVDPAQHASMAKRDNDPSEFERVARAGWMVTLRYRLLLLSTQPPPRATRWPWAAGGASAAMAVAGVITKLGWF